MKKRITALIALLLMVASVTWSGAPTPPYSLPSQVGNSGKFLTTDGTNESWGTAPGAGVYQPIDTFLTNIAALTPTAGCILLGGATDTAACYAMSGTSGNLLRSVASGSPAWTTATFPNTATGTGTLIRADGTNWVASTITIPDTAVAGDILYASNTSVWSSLAKGVAYQRLRMNSGATAPEWEYPQEIINTKSSGATMTKAEFCGGYIRATATETLTYPTITSDMVGCKTRYVVQGAYTLSIDVPAAVTPTLNGTALTAGNKVANSGFSGESVDAVIVSTTAIEYTNGSGTWIDNGA